MGHARTEVKRQGGSEFAVGRRTQSRLNSATGLRLRRLFCPPKPSVEPLVGGIGDDGIPGNQCVPRSGVLQRRRRSLTCKSVLETACVHQCRQDATGAIHLDIQKGFIRADIASYADVAVHGGETGARSARQQRLENKAYVMQDYDMTNFRFNR